MSTPRVTTQNLKRATIRSGLQIPVQTVANNTVTVQYVDATLNLDVTPQITAEGTVNIGPDHQEAAAGDRRSRSRAATTCRSSPAT